MDGDMMRILNVANSNIFSKVSFCYSLDFIYYLYSYTDEKLFLLRHEKM